MGQIHHEECMTASSAQLHAFLIAWRSFAYSTLWDRVQPAFVGLGDYSSLTSCMCLSCSWALCCRSLSCSCALCCRSCDRCWHCGFWARGLQRVLLCLTEAVARGGGRMLTLDRCCFGVKGVALSALLFLLPLLVVVVALVLLLLSLVLVLLSLSAVATMNTISCRTFVIMMLLSLLLPSCLSLLSL